MQILNDLPALVQALPQRAATDWVDLPAALHRQLSSAAQTDPGAILLQPGARCLVRTGTDAPRMGYVPWLPVAVLRQMDWSQPLPQLLQAELGHSQRFAPQDAVIWADAQVPAPHWPDRPGDAPQRLQFWHLGLQAHAWMAMQVCQPTPISRAALRVCEWRLGCPLPPALRDYWLHLGVQDWVEGLLAAAWEGQAPGRDWAAIGPVQVVFPGVMDIVAMADPQDAATLRAGIADLVAFGDYLGNGNLWCFSRTDGAVWYLDHDSAPLLTRVFDDVGDYLDALALMALCTAQATAQGRDDGDAQAEAWLSARWGPAMVRKWMY